MRRRLLERELLDLPGPTRGEIEGNLRDIRTANRWLGGTAVVLSHLSRMIGDDPVRQPVRILDVATGLADIPVAIVCWADRHGIAVSIMAIDKNPAVAEFAQKHTRDLPEIAVYREDALDMPYRDGSFHYVICSQVIHHLATEEVVSLFRSANRLATQGIIVSDLQRRPMCTAAADFASLFIRNRLSRHDARVSFHNAFSMGDLREMANQAGLSCFRVHAHGPCRMALVVDKRACVKQREAEKRYASIALALV